MNRIIIDGDQARLYGTPKAIPQGQSQFSQVQFSFSEEWDDLRKIAQFEQKGNPYNVEVSDDRCFCPSELVKGVVNVRVKGYPVDTTSAVIATANEVVLPVSAGFQSGGIPPVPPTPDLYQKLIEEFSDKVQFDWAQNDPTAKDYVKNRTHWVGDDGTVHKLNPQFLPDNYGGSVDPDDIAKVVADYLAAHPIEETDPTVPEWAKAKTKPTYSAAEVGAISQSDLQAATDAALAQAKASGEFDGPAGAPGKDGAGMDITGATVGQIAKISAVDDNGKPTAWETIDGYTGQVTVDNLTNPDHPTDLVQYAAFRAAVPMVQQMGISGATVGQIIKVKAVNSDGCPTAWEPVDMPAGGGSTWEKVYDGSNTIAEEISVFEVDLAKNDPMKEFQLWLKLDQNTATDWGANKNIQVTVNGEIIGYFFFSHRLNTYVEFYEERSLEAMTVAKRCMSVVNLGYNATSPMWMVGQGVKRQNNGKLSISFPAPYAGKITAKVYGRY